jgi:hypothetical protein
MVNAAKKSAVVPAAPINVRSWGENGLNADMPQRPNLTHLGHAWSLFAAMHGPITA